MSADDLERVVHERDNRSGTVLAQRYRLQRRLSVGGMGEVYEARHAEIPRRFAVKLLRAEFARDPQMRARFRIEAETAASLSSDHIVEVTDFGHAEDGSPYLVMELLEGVDLRRLLAKAGRLPVEQAVAVALETCAGLAIAHAQDVVHRDLKPENLFLARRGDRTALKLLDFGIAKLRNQSLGTGGGRLLGTPAYMPPEQVRGDAGIDGRADIYALGVILYEMLGGKVPHPGTGQHEIITHILFGEPVPLRELNPEVPAELAAIVHKMLAVAPDDRYPSVGEIERALAPFAADGMLPPVIAEDAASQPTPPARSSEPDLARRSSAGSVPPAERAAGAHRASRPWSRARGRWLLVAAALLLVAGLVSILQFRGHGMPPTDTPADATDDWVLVRPNASEAPLLAPAPRARVTTAPQAAEAVHPDSDAPADPVPEPAQREHANAARRAARRRTAAARPKPPPPATPAPEKVAADPAKVAPVSQSAPAKVAPAQSTPADDGSLIEVQRGQAPLIFKRNNPLRR